MNEWKIADDNLIYNGTAAVKGLSGDFETVPDSKGNGVFLSMKQGKRNPCAHTKLGIPAEFERFSSMHVVDANFFWSLPAVGNNLSGLFPYTEWLMLKGADGFYTMIVPLPSSNAANFVSWYDSALSVYTESGDSRTLPAAGICAYVSRGRGMWDLIRKGAESVSAALPAAKLRRKKPYPEFAEKFGWCTWNAFYRHVDFDKVRCGLETLRDAKIPPRFIILDDGWQETEDGPYGGSVLSGMDANSKFPGGIKAAVDMAKSGFGIEKFLVWHAVCGYWNGISSGKLNEFRPKDTPVFFGRHAQYHSVFDWMGSRSFAVPAKRFAKFYDAYHSSLAAAGVDGVKIDNQGSIAFLGEGNGGRTVLCNEMRTAANRTTKKYFNSNFISCMAHAPEVFYNCLTNNLIRGSDDFYPDQTSLHGAHLYANAMTGVWIGEFMWADWDMFVSGDPSAAYHAAGRAVSGGPVYIADEPGKHNAEVVRKLVMSDGSVTRCAAPGRLSSDCIFRDVRTERVLLKVFNTTPFGGIAGIFNANYHEDKTGIEPIDGAFSPSDVEGLECGSFAVWFHNAGKCIELERSGRTALSLAEGGFEVITAAPVRKNGIGVIGLTGLYNALGGVSGIKDIPNGTEVSLRDGGDFAAWSRTKPSAVQIDGASARFTWDNGLVKLYIPSDGTHTVKITM